MRTEAIKVDDPFVEVEKVPLIRPGGQSSSRSAVLLNTEEEKIEVGVVSNDYRLIPNLEVRNIALDILTRMDIPFEERQGL